MKATYSILQGDSILGPFTYAQMLADTLDRIRLSSTLEGMPKELIPLVREQGLEGIVAKERDSVYEPGKRSGKWQKFKLYQEAELLIGGFIPSGQCGVESVVLGLPEQRQLRYVAALDVRLPLKASRQLADKLDRISTAKNPFGEIPRRTAGNSWSGGMTEQQKAAVIWVKPKYKAEVSFLEWTRGGFPRHAQVKRLLTESS